ncbi:hypothetical protein NC653_015085 [Populus alba x Populus x berolinensis]|uniref:Uncharacterized protein n=1 Tax=Populus alba x Populus x berolinensis TaxID=444605 RepID=A0AAD6R0A2_9ROSI|nr:hypothetical protein NC653_015085 [Populus alba x Populus x berolinensis]
MVPLPTFYSTFMLKMGAHLVGAVRAINIKISCTTTTSMYRSPPTTTTTSTISNYGVPKMINGALWRMCHWVCGCRLSHTSTIILVISSSRWLSNSFLTCIRTSIN